MDTTQHNRIGAAAGGSVQLVEVVLYRRAAQQQPTAGWDLEDGLFGDIESFSLKTMRFIADQQPDGGAL